MSKPPAKVVYAPRAKRDLVDRASFLAAEAAQRCTTASWNRSLIRVDLLAQTPEIGRIFPVSRKRNSDLYTFPVTGAFHRTVIFYTFSATELRVERILQSTQNLPRFFR